MQGILEELKLRLKWLRWYRFFYVSYTLYTLKNPLVKVNPHGYEMWENQMQRLILTNTMKVLYVARYVVDWT
ncbi:MAG TPA: hypothetical protein DHV25_02245 [Candidatus Kerfeldbacteria bacterium]|nr:hypothetical protein [Candidatus Kerfeldbacteria bacterium]